MLNSAVVVDGGIEERKLQFSSPLGVHSSLRMSLTSGEGHVRMRLSARAAGLRPGPPSSYRWLATCSFSPMQRLHESSFLQLPRSFLKQQRGCRLA